LTVGGGGLRPAKGGGEQKNGQKSGGKTKSVF
jgi:hypothetical protein